ncbi:MAG: HIT family protein [Chloroflexota bacterium]
MPITLANGELCQCCVIAAGEMPSLTEVRRSALTITCVIPRQHEVGHLIVFPVRHVPTLMELTNEETAAIATETRAMAAALQAAYSDVEGFLIYQNNGTASFQEVPHVHMHVVPRRVGGGWPRMRFGWSRPAVPERAELMARLIEARP